jgi:TRAP-type C4-dicarboxylate transport system substrate-binding protein
MGKTLASTAMFAVMAAVGTGAAYAQCDSGETVIKFSHVVAEKTPKGQAAQAFADRVNSELDRAGVRRGLSEQPAVQRRQGSAGDAAG